jgi:hypothetical protein
MYIKIISTIDNIGNKRLASALINQSSVFDFNALIQEQIDETINRKRIKVLSQVRI